MIFNIQKCVHLANLDIAYVLYIGCWYVVEAINVLLQCQAYVLRHLYFIFIQNTNLLSIISLSQKFDPIIYFSSFKFKFSWYFFREFSPKGPLGKVEYLMISMNIFVSLYLIIWIDYSILLLILYFTDWILCFLLRWPSSSWMFRQSFEIQI